jgi:hypothetical protein
MERHHMERRHGQAVPTKRYHFMLCIGHLALVVQSLIARWD